MSFEVQHFGKGDKKHEDLIPLLFSKEYSNASLELLKVVSENGQNDIFAFFPIFLTIHIPPMSLCLI